MDESIVIDEIRTVAAIDIGSTAIRMTIADIEPTGRMTTLDALTQPTNLGRDTFSTGSIKRNTIENCVSVLKQFTNILAEYQFEDPKLIRAVATTAVREADNREAFLNRIFIATGIEVDIIDEAEVTRLNYRSLQTRLLHAPELSEQPLVLAEIGAGSTDMFAIEDGLVVFSHTYSFGALRIRSMFDQYDKENRASSRDLMSDKIQQGFAGIYDSGILQEGTNLMAMGDDVKFAVRVLDEAWKPGKIACIALKKFEQFVNDMLESDVDHLVRKFHLPITEAETIAPALLCYLKLAQSCKAKVLYFTDSNLREGLLGELGSNGGWSDEFINQILVSARDLGRKYEFDEKHAEHVAFLSQELFIELQDEHGLGAEEQVILHVAALLHEVGMFINNRAFHKHSLYVILHSELFGFGKRQLELAGLVARYHRRANPKPTHEYFGVLSRGDSVIVSKLAAILRVADALDASHHQRVKRFKCSKRKGQLNIIIPRTGDTSLLNLSLKEKGNLFDAVFGLKVRLEED